MTASIILPDEPLPPAPPPPRPWTVTAAAALQGVSFSIGMVATMFTLHWGAWQAVALFSTMAGLMGLWVRGLYRGRPWARLLVYVVAVLSLNILGKPNYGAHSAAAGDRFLVQLVLNTTVVILLLLPASRRWHAAVR